MARLNIRVLAEGTPVKIKGERGQYTVIGAAWKGGREVDDLLRTDGGSGPYRTVTRDKLRVLRPRHRST
jgi:hypothetical protein